MNTESTLRRSIRRAVAISVAMVATMALAVMAQAGTVLTLTGFEADDGNLTVEDLAQQDWNGFAPTTWTGSAPYRQTAKAADATGSKGWKFAGFEDAAALNSDTAFSGGVKQDQECPGTNAGKAPNKDDLERIYLSSKTVEGFPKVDGTAGTEAHMILNLAWVRIPQNTTSASAHVAFEFNKGTESCATPQKPSDLVKRVAGDMLVVYDFEGGATETPTITLRRWVTSGSCEVGNSTPPCWGLAANLTANNGAEAKVFVPATAGATTEDAIAPSPPDNLGDREFGEAGIDLTKAGVFTPGVCEGFGTVTAASRSSGNSGTAQMKDRVGPGPFSIANCGAIKVSKTSVKGNAPLAGATFTITKNGTQIAGSPFLTGSSGSFCVGALAFGSYVVTETAAPAGYAIDDPNPRTVTVDTVASCTDATYVGESTSFSDTPLSKIQVKFESLAGPGVTAASIVCKNASNVVVAPVLENGLADPAYDDTDETITNLRPGVYTCTIDVDP